ncbi:unnamed protein product [Rotaria socialis]|uniref:Transposase n=1 Tax=Rotaria socialis TaxID=392032 RepID=A0A821NRW7_9BILA|nr:unnamed protein product [Rotaria socialis]CAF3352321.1 unnamed protein product [Rotaria socialis]CAF3353194.1 unnamed protein product [Rotaria socialis]CAF3714714.1 unnamed protein product [Rotaria socialis]CAF4243233.1 unnamed protein product [Rotaria socialis]
MKSKDLRNVVLLKYENGDRPSKIFHDLAGAISLRTIWRWIKMIKDTGAIDLSTPPGRTRTARTTGNIKKVKQRIMRRKRSSGRKIARDLAVSQTSVRRILHEDLGLFPYKIIKEPAITEIQKEQRMKFVNWVKNNFNNDDIKRWLFSDEKLFDFDGVYNVQNDRIWAANRQEADAKGGIKKKHKLPTKVMVWLGACRNGLTTPVILDNGTVNHEKYIEQVLPVALKCGNEMMGSD